MTFKGFPRSVRYLPVPAPMFGPLLEQIKDASGFIITLRIIWMLQQKKGRLRYVSSEEVFGDKILANALGSKEAIQNSINMVVKGGILLQIRRENASDAFMLNSESDREIASDIGSIYESNNQPADPWEIENTPPEIYSLYEQNIGILTPIMSEKLTEAEDKYPAGWIKEAVGIAVEQNRRSWAYVSRILERWDMEGRDESGDGKPPRYPKIDRLL